jgi:zinc transporter 7
MVATNNAIIAALSSTVLISLAPNVLLVLFPHYGSGEGESSKLLALGQALAAGGLLGDVFLHTIPHAGGDHDVGLWVLLGFTIFLVADMLMRSLGGHSHSHGKNEDDKHHQEQHKTATVYLNLAADALHNFTDGLAIGASFAGDTHEHASVVDLMKSRGGLATLSILCHEIPHELGDFAILVKNGFSKRQAIVAQFGTALAALLGTVVGILLEGFAGESLLFVTAGGFVYLAAVTILPEILEEPDTSFKFRILQLLCFGAGVAFLYAVTLLEGMGNGGGHHHGHSHGHHQHDVHVEEHRILTEPVHHEHHEHHHHEEHQHHEHGHQEF